MEDMTLIEFVIMLMVAVGFAMCAAIVVIPEDRLKNMLIMLAVWLVATLGMVMFSVQVEADSIEDWMVMPGLPGIEAYSDHPKQRIIIQGSDGVYFDPWSQDMTIFANPPLPSTKPKEFIDRLDR